MEDEVITCSYHCNFLHLTLSWANSLGSLITETHQPRASVNTQNHLVGIWHASTKTLGFTFTNGEFCNKMINLPLYNSYFISHFTNAPWLTHPYTVYKIIINISGCIRILPLIISLTNLVAQKQQGHQHALFYHYSHQKSIIRGFHANNALVTISLSPFFSLIFSFFQWWWWSRDDDHNDDIIHYHKCTTLLAFSQLVLISCAGAVSCGVWPCVCTCGLDRRPAQLPCLGRQWLGTLESGRVAHWTHGVPPRGPGVATPGHCLCLCSLCPPGACWVQGPLGPLTTASAACTGYCNSQKYQYKQSQMLY